MTILTIHDYITALWQTIYTVLVSSSVAVIIGLCLGCWLYDLNNNHNNINKYCYGLLDIIVNLGRSTPFIILLIALIPITRFIVGTSIGVNAALVPLTIAAIPLYARITQGALQELPISIKQYALSLGISTYSIYRYIFIPEIRVPLIQGAALTIISLINYSAIAGAIGGGGIGQLAIDYGYQRFNLSVILITVAILFVLVQLIQWYGNRLCQKLKVTIPTIVFFALAAISIVIYNFPWQNTSQHIIKLGVMSGNSTAIFNQLEPIASKKYGIHYKVVSFDDYSIPNRALNDGDIDINIFQHKPFLDADIKSHGYHILPIIKNFSYPIGFYSKRIKKLSDLHSGSIIAISNDASNQGRELNLLAKHHFITLKPGTGLLANIHNITQNPYHLNFITLDSAALPRALQDADLVAINNDFLKDVHLQADQALLKEGRHNPYVNIAVVRTSEKNNPQWQQWRRFLHSKEAIAIRNKYYPHGEAVPGW